MSRRKADSKKSDTDTVVRERQNALKEAARILKLHFKDAVILASPGTSEDSDTVVRWDGNFMACYGMGAAFVKTALNRYDD